MLHETSSILGAAGIAIVGTPNGAVGSHCSEGLDEVIHRFVNEGWHQQNPRLSAALRKGMTTASVATEWNCFSKEELERLPFNADFLSKMGFRPFSGAMLGERDGNVILLSIERRAQQGPFTKEDIERLETLLPCLQQAVRLAIQLAAAREGGLLRVWT